MIRKKCLLAGLIAVGMLASTRMVSVAGWGDSKGMFIDTVNPGNPKKLNARWITRGRRGTTKESSSPSSPSSPSHEEPQACPPIPAP